MKKEKFFSDLRARERMKRPGEVGKENKINMQIGEKDHDFVHGANNSCIYLIYSHNFDK